MMEYAALASVYRDVERTDADTEKTTALATLFREAGDRLVAVVRLTRGRVYPRHADAELGVSSALTTAAVEKATGVDADQLEKWWRETGDLGSAAERAVAERSQQTLASVPLTVDRVYETLRKLAGYEGSGSRDRKVDAVAGLVSDAEPMSARFVVRTALGHLRIGVGDGTVRAALAEAFDTPADIVERAHQLTNDLGLVAERARAEGAAGLESLDVAVGRPVESMLARAGEDLADEIAAVGDGETAYLEVKYDGIRVQIHIDGDDVRVFTRRLEEVTAQFPEVVTAVQAGVDADQCILDGELVGYDPDTGQPVAFQRLSQRVRRKHDVERLAEEVPVTVHLFDCLYDGESLLEASLSDRLSRLAALVEETSGLERAEHLWAADETAAREFYRTALEAGHEGVMCKNPDAPYTPGRRVDTMTKVKPTMEPLDLVVTRATYSEGRRAEQLGRLYLACYDADRETFREVGRLSTGYTDEQLAALTERLESLVRERDGRDVELVPDVVVQVAYEEIQASSEYESGYALRFPRFEGIREDLAPTEADQHERVEQLYEDQ
ncbi:ATP-dependent DNA ligase [Halosegnis sp.]|uniref:ATP-dependent DNA ligase n=1 Tax=Halosegnis sp. TaxID=2864959 RepID=UPI0035D45E6A